MNDYTPKCFFDTVQHRENFGTGYSTWNWRPSAYHHFFKVLLNITDQLGQLPTDLVVGG